MVRMQHEMLRRISAIPGVSSAAFANSVPTDRNDSTDLLYAEDRTYAEGQMPPLRRFKFVAPGFFQTLGTRLIAGRDLTWTDIYDQRPVVMISENMARELWRVPAAAIGKRIREQRPHGRKQQHRSALRRRPDLCRGATAAASPVQVRRAGLFSDDWDPADCRTRLYMDRHL